MTPKRPGKVTQTRTVMAPKPVAGEDAADSQGTGLDMVLHGQGDAGNPLASRAVFWQPRHLTASPNLVHMPFLFWLVETLRPVSVVQIGLGDGVGFMGLCQAIDKLALDATVLGLDVAGQDKNSFAEKLGDTHAGLYGDFAVLSKDEPGRAARHMRNAEIDLLVIDTPLDPALVSSLQAHWLPLLSERGVLVLHDPARHLTDPAAQDFHTDLIEAHDLVSFPEAGAGLDVILIGAAPPDRLTQLASLDMGKPGYLSVRQVFSRLGQALENAQQNRSKTSQLDKARSNLKELQAKFDDLQTAHGKLQTALEDAHRSEDAQATQAATLQARLFDLSRDLDALRADTAPQAEFQRLHAELATRDAQLAEQAEELAALTTALTEAREERAQIEAQAEARAEARAAEMAADAAQALAARDAQLAELTEARDAAERARAELAEELEALRGTMQTRLEQAQEKRLALWEAHESLKLHHQVLLRQQAAQTPPAAAEGLESKELRA